MRGFFSAGNFGKCIALMYPGFAQEFRRKRVNWKRVGKLRLLCCTQPTTSKMNEQVPVILQRLRDGVVWRPFRIPLLVNASG
jgi:hypothetical protein